MPAWTSDARLVFAPAKNETDDRTIAEVDGKPPNKLQVMLPTPCATSSRSASYGFLSLESLSRAEAESSDSMEAVPYCPAKREG